jgi:hypothetical protein
MYQLMYVHPAGQALAFFCGFFNIVTGLTRKGFNISVHINFGAIYYFMTLLGIGVGVIASNWAQKNNVKLELEIHEWNAIVMIFLFITGAVTGLIMLSDQGKRVKFLKYHKWVNVTGIICFMVQGVTGMFALVS